MSAVGEEAGRWSRVESLLDEALELPIAEQRVLLDRACADEPQLRARVDALLAADQQAGDFLVRADEAVAELLGDDDAEASPVGEDLGPYRLIREIAAGGMGVVYEGVHTRLRRRVAIKLLPPELYADPAARERLSREARAVAILDDPHICGVHDLAESDGRLYMVMPLCEGETLKERLRRGPLPVAEVRAIAVQVARALVRAHAAGIIHRDLKPANVMVDANGGIKMLDFGIAKVRGDPSLTRMGESPGTPAYMSPEQVRGEAVDARSDVWGLGVLLYEMIGGQRAFAAKDDRAVLHAIAEREPLALERLRPDAPLDLARVIRRAMAKGREERYQDAAAMLRDLEGGAVAGDSSRTWWKAAAAVMLVAAACAVVVLGWRALSPHGPPSVARATAPHVPTIGVVALVNRTGRQDLDWYGGAIARLVMDSLSDSRHLRVASERRGEALAEAASGKDLVRRAAGAGIDVVLTGEILSTPTGLRVEARVEDVREARVLNAFHRDGLAPHSLLDAADDIAGVARKGLGIPPRGAVGGLAADFLAHNPEAYGDYVRGLAAFLRFHYAEAEPSFLEALRKAPDFTMARYRLAQVYYVTSRTNEALAEIRRAVAEAGGLPDREARYLRAGEALFARRTDEAIADYRALIERYPYETEARFQLAQALISVSRNEEALAELTTLQGLEPENPLTWSMAGAVEYQLRRHEKALQDLGLAIARDPQDVYSRYMRGLVYEALGELEMATMELTEALRLKPDFAAAKLTLAELEVANGRELQGEQQLAALASDRDLPPRYRISAALDLAYLHRSQGRFAAAEQALEARRAEIEAEQVRVPMVLIVRGLSRLDRGDLPQARRWLEAAVVSSGDKRTRHLCALVARGQLELRQQAWGDVEATAHQLRGATTPDRDDRSEEKAAAYLLGLRWLASDRTGLAVEELSRAVALDGEECAVYRLGLARALLGAGKAPEALAAAQQAATDGARSVQRLDLALDRTRALLVIAEAQQALGHPAQAAAAARQFLAKWQRAEPGSAELAKARMLAGG